MADTKGEIVLCFECGTKNRLAHKYDGMPRCGKCGEPLPVTARGTSRRSETPRKSGLGLPSRFLVVLGLLAIVGYVIVEARQTRDKRDAQLVPLSAPTSNDWPPPPGFVLDQDAHAQISQPPLELVPAPVVVRPGVIFKNTKAKSIAPLQIKTSRGSNYVVKLVDLETNDDVVGIYVVGGRTLNVQVPLGRYRMRYASGQTWYGFEYRFGPKTIYAEAHDVFHFAVRGNEISGYTVELIQQVDGNLQTRSINERQF